MGEPKLNAVVTLRNELSPWLIILQVAPDGWELPDFVAGQYICLGLFGSAPRSALAETENAAAEPDKLIRRAYSIASSPLSREFMEFYLNLVPGGVLTPRLFNLKIGDRIWLSSRVTGTFTLDHVPEDANVVLIANGTGLAPYVSMLTTHLQSAAQRRVALVHGARHSWDLGYRSVLTAMQNLRPNFNYIPVLSRPQDEPIRWKGAAGHVQDLWKGDAIERAWGFRPAPQNTHVLLCGSPEMIESMTLLLAQEGFEEHAKNHPGQVHSERYWPIKGGAKESSGALVA
ncbi:MAG: ferredoxin--NADP reductase [Acidobacteriaceae bacterium]|nr:ferredoxin--NADP reductase [Acidobacteriaceae bacterium]